MAAFLVFGGGNLASASPTVGKQGVNHAASMINPQSRRPRGNPCFVSHIERRLIKSPATETIRWG
jgi:hypothetical protein